MDKTATLKARSVIRPLVLLPLVVGLGLAFAATASAATTIATVDNQATNGSGNPGPSCPGWFYCGTANVPGYGPALWVFNSPGPLMGTPDPTQPDCSDYAGTSTFTFTGGTRLVLNEHVVLCHPGNSGNAANFWKNEFGHPNRGGGTWSVCTPATKDPTGTDTGCGWDDGTGQLLYSTNQSLTGGGTDWMQTDGARLTATWSGTVTP